MTLKSAFRNLSQNLESLGDELLALRLTIREDSPLISDSALVDIFGDAVDDMFGWLSEAEAAVKSLDKQSDLSATWQTLTIAHERFSWMQAQFHDLASYDRLAPLIRFGKEQGGEWQVWANSVKHGLDQGRDALSEVDEALFQCWQEIAERAGMTSVSVRTTNVGQQIAMPEAFKTAADGAP
jgi:hypothetical protein